MLDVKLFGSFEITNRGSSSIRLTGRPRSLFAYLVLHRGRFFSRAELLLTLWSDRNDVLNAGTLNTALWRLRKSVGCPLANRGELIASTLQGDIGLAEGADLASDVEKFTTLVSTGLEKPIEQLSTSDIARLQTGVGLYHADILCSFTDEWALRERERHRHMYLNALGRLFTLSERAGDYDCAIRYAQTFLEHDPLREDIHRELMRLFVLTGQQVLALRQYETCRALLKRELAIQPMLVTRQLYQQIANNAVGSPTEQVRLLPDGDSTPTVHASVAQALDHLADLDRCLQGTLRLLGQK